MSDRHSEKPRWARDAAAASRAHSYLQQSPKIDLHVHLEGAVRPPRLLQILRRNGLHADLRTEADLAFSMAAEGAHFGVALSSGDLDGDGYADLLVGSDRPLSGGAGDPDISRGGVAILWGRPGWFEGGADPPVATEDVEPEPSTKRLPRDEDDRLSLSEEPEPSTKRLPQDGD